MQGLQQYAGSSSSSDDDDAQQVSSAVARPAPARINSAVPTKRRKRLTLHLPAEIQAALEGRSIDSDSDDEALAAAKRRRVRPTGSEQKSLAGLLNVLPPKVACPAPAVNRKKSPHLAQRSMHQQQNHPCNRLRSLSSAVASSPNPPMAKAAAEPAAEPTRAAAANAHSTIGIGDADFGLVSQLPCGADRQQASKSMHRPVTYTREKSVACTGLQSQRQQYQQQEQHQQHQQHYEHLQHQQNLQETLIPFGQAPGYHSRESCRGRRQLPHAVISMGGRALRMYDGPPLMCSTGRHRGKRITLRPLVLKGATDLLASPVLEF